MNTLLAWPISRRTPSTSTGSNGEPVATTARPAVQRRMSAGVASALDVGLESGMTIGRAVPLREARMTASSNAPPTPVVPTSTAGRTRSIVSTSARELGREAVPGEGVGRQRKPRLPSSRSSRRSWTRPVRIDQHDRPPDAASGMPVLEHRETEQARDADARRARPDEHDTRVGEARPEPRKPASTPATTTAAVPWMSSLKDGTRSR